MTIDSETPFEGAAGRTKKVRRTIAPPDGDERSVEVFQTLNVLEHPHLAHRALAGDLHDEVGEASIDISYVYHDPGRSLFALVIARADEAREIELRVDVLRRLDEEAELPPQYVRNFKVVYGAAELRAVADGPIDERRLEEEAVRLEAWAAALQQEDANLRASLREIEREELDPRTQDSGEIELDVFDISLDGGAPSPSAVPVGFGDLDVSPPDVVNDLDGSDVDEVEDEYSDVTDVRRLESIASMDNSALLMQSNLLHAKAVPGLDFWERVDTEFSLMGTDEGAEAFVSVDGEETLAFQDGVTRFEVKSKVLGGRPVVVFIVEDPSIRARRLAFVDPTDKDGRVSLRALIARPEVLLTVFDEGGHSRRAFYVHHRAAELSREILDRWPPGEAFDIAWERAVSKARQDPTSDRH